MSEAPATDDELTGDPHDTPPGEHASELPDESDAVGSAAQEENAQTSEDQPSQ